jgi:hypothetical protein
MCCVHAADATGQTIYRKDGFAKQVLSLLLASFLMFGVVAATLTCVLAVVAQERLICQVVGLVATRGESKNQDQHRLHLFWLRHRRP